MSKNKQYINPVKTSTRKNKAQQPKQRYPNNVANKNVPVTKPTTKPMPEASEPNDLLPTIGATWVFAAVVIGVFALSIIIASFYAANR